MSGWTIFLYGLTMFLCNCTFGYVFLFSQTNISFLSSWSSNLLGRWLCLVRLLFLSGWTTVLYGLTMVLFSWIVRLSGWLDHVAAVWLDYVLSG